MKKSLIALTLAALPVAAMADVTLYGQVKAGVEVSRTKETVNHVSTKTKLQLKLLTLVPVSVSKVTNT